MPTNKPGKNLVGQEGLSFANALRDCLVSGVILIDTSRQTATLTKEAAHILGLKAAQEQELALKALPKPLLKIIEETLDSGKPTPACQLEVNVASHGVLTLRISAVPVTPGRKGSSVALVINNLTPARELQEHIRQLDRLANVGTLAASMAHEIKNALVAGKTFIDLLLEKNQGAELVGIVRREIGRIDAITNRMLKFASPARAAFTAVHLHEVLDHSLRLVQHQFEVNSISLDRSFQAASDLVSGDDYELQQAFVNLSLNALEAMGSNGTLTVATEVVTAVTGPPGWRKSERPPQLRVTIKDTGPGIPAESIGRVFEPFFTTKPAGTGLGLAVTRRIIQEHCGTIAVESQPGHGTTFSIILPALNQASG